MAEAPIMPFYTDAYLADTGHLTTIEHGAYLLLLFTMWRGGGSLDSDPKKLARYCKLTPGQFKKIWPSLEPFFHVDDERIFQGKLQENLEAVRRKSQSARDSARAKWRKTKETGDANASNSQCGLDAIHKPLSKEKKNIQKREPSDQAVLTLHSQPESRTQSRVDHFENVWKTVRQPRKNRKKDAEKKWKTIAKTVPVETLVKGYEAYTRSRASQDPQYDLHLTKWLENSMWEDTTPSPDDYAAKDALRARALATLAERNGL